MQAAAGGSSSRGDQVTVMRRAYVTPYDWGASDRILTGIEVIQGRIEDQAGRCLLVRWAGLVVKPGVMVFDCVDEILPKGRPTLPTRRWAAASLVMAALKRRSSSASTLSYWPGSS